ncbi:CDP-alcohol phosphatidyltransferase family protein [Clostridium aminobutyricum]|uniref:CDP-alcohol phosphatidyltransferase family protein n=1 Tax=Clostridium aminobutyricum TaxID=33953 RepID=A0A939DA32_CLOAM|nr:CDP-alcohol phosphatidyltransferase family protein [Clostridium aminobutyricum]MBN7773543.1 CDP-alcohol phosphatidyltransferase family protein [Clostridium aminobutyricum]
MKGLIKFIPNSITISRIGLSVLFVTNVTGQFVYEKNNFMNLIVLFSVICLTDLIDGKIARKIRCTSVTGAKLDVLADLFFIVASNITLISLGILPLWFLGFIFFKFIEFIITSDFTIRHKYLSNKNVFISDKLGRIVAAMFFVIPGIAFIFHILIPSIAENAIHFILYATLAGGILSSYLRVKSCLKLKS